MNTRNQVWLEAKLADLLSRHFSDLDIGRNLEIRFSKRSKRQLGCIARKQSRLPILLKRDAPSEIRINGYFKDESIPEVVIEGTIIHELCHYVHGFSSPLPQKLRYPHQGGAIKKEMIKRGAGDIYLAEKKWLKHHWQNYLKTHT